MYQAVWGHVCGDLATDRRSPMLGQCINSAAHVAGACISVNANRLHLTKRGLFVQTIMNQEASWLSCALTCLAALVSTSLSN